MFSFGAETSDRVVSSDYDTASLSPTIDVPYDGVYVFGRQFRHIWVCVSNFYKLENIFN